MDISTNTSIAATHERQGAWRLLAPSVWPWTLLVGDATLLGLTALATWRADAALERPAVLVVYPLIVLALLAVRGGYSRRVRRSALDAIYAACAALTLAAMTLVSVATAVGVVEDVASAIGRLWLFGLVLVGGGRSLLVAVRRRAHSQGRAMRSTVIVGDGVVGARVARRLREEPQHGLLPAAVVDDPGDALDAVARTGARHVVLAFSTLRDAELVPYVQALYDAGVKVSMVPRLFEVLTPQVEVARLGALPLLELHPVDPKGRRLAAKYAIDRCLAALLLVVAAPVILVLAAGVRFTSAGPVVIRQRRVGLDGREFDLLKFRSMRMRTGAAPPFRPRPGLAPGGVEGEDRRTGLGKWLRRSNLDELPQLVNVLRGEMSLVGPRPERPAYVHLFTQSVRRYNDRHRVKAGITGWAQVNGLRGQTSIAERVEYDNYYVQHLSPALDLKILLLTGAAMLFPRRERVSEVGVGRLHERIGTQVGECTSR